MRVPCANAALREKPEQLAGHHHHRCGLDKKQKEEEEVSSLGEIRVAHPKFSSGLSHYSVQL
jgi:hypothetical protein